MTTKDNSDLLSHVSRGHSLLGGSKAYQYINCYGSVAMQEGLPDIVYKRTDLGTKCHEVGQICLGDFLEHKVSGSDPDIRYTLHPIDGVTDEEAADIRSAAEIYRDVVWERVLLKSVTGKAFGLEEKFHLNKKLKMFGFIDFWCVYIDRKGRRTLAVVDFKYGFTEVAVEKNWQLIYYLLCVLRFIRRHGKDIDVFRAIIIQPPLGEDRQYKEATYTPKQLETYEKKLMKAAHEILVKKSHKKKAGDWCKWCKASTVCDTYIKSLEAKSSLAIIDPKAEVKLPRPDQLSAEQVAKIVLHSSELEKFLRSCKAYVYSQCAQGNSFPLIKVIEERGKRGWIKDVKKIEKTLKKFNVTDIYSSKLKPLTQIEKMLKKPKVFQKLVTASTKRMIVEKSDPRPELKSFEGMLDDE